MFMIKSVVLVVVFFVESGERHIEHWLQNSAGITLTRLELSAHLSSSAQYIFFKDR